MNRFPATLALLISMGALASGEPRFLPILKSTFKIPAGSAADQAGCGNCHTTPPTRNAFGKQVEQALTDAHAEDVTQQILLSIQNLDADGDGYTNGEELRAGYLPGDAKSHPTKHGDQPTADGTSNGGLLNRLIPKHTFHPAFVHFPIALYTFGVLLDVLGAMKRERKFREGASWSYLAAALSLCVVIPTGLISSFRQGYQLAWGQPVFTHFLCAITASLGIIASAIWLKKRWPSSIPYWVLLALTTAALSAAGYFGGELVY